MYSLLLITWFGAIAPVMISSRSNVLVVLGLITSVIIIVVVFNNILNMLKNTKEIQMKKFAMFLLLVFFVPLFFSSCSKVPAGHVGIKVYLLGSDKGVDSEELGVGRYHIGINEELYLFPTFRQNYVWTKDEKEGSLDDESFTFQTKEGLEASVDLGITYHLDKTKINTIFQEYRRGINEITDVFMRNNVRDSLNQIASKMEITSVYGAGKSQLINDVHESVKNNLYDTGIIVDKIYLICSIRLPRTVITALNNKVQATQRAQQRENELREAQAEAKKRIAQAEGEATAILTRAKAEAEANRLVSNSLTEILNQYEKIKKWDGKLPGVTGGAIPFLDIKN